VAAVRFSWRVLSVSAILLCEVPPFWPETLTTKVFPLTDATVPRIPRPCPFCPEAQVPFGDVPIMTARELI
jgi:hypothetical protein